MIQKVLLLFSSYHKRIILLLDYPIRVLIVLAILMLMSRLSLTYVNSQRRVQAPEYLYAYETVAHDWFTTSVEPAYQIREGKTMSPNLGYGSSVPVLLAPILPVLQTSFCKNLDQFNCGFQLYKILIPLSLFGYYAIAIISTKYPKKRDVALLFVTLYFLGLPAGRGIETGNIDIFLALFTASILLLIHTTTTSRRILITFICGVLAGFSSNAKIMLAVFLPIFTVFSHKRFFFLISAITSFSLFALLPQRLYRSPMPWNAAYIYADIALEPIATGVYRSYPHGNNSIWAMASGVIHTLDISTQQNDSINILAIVIGTIIFLVPCMIYAKQIYFQLSHYKTIRKLSSRNELLVTIYTFAVVIINLVPIMAYDYRTLYLIPPIIIIWNTSQSVKTNRYIVAAMILLLLKSLWIPSGRVLNIYLYSHYLIVLIAALSFWLDRKESVVKF